MLINIDDFSKITTIAHEKEFNAWKKKLTIEEFKSIEDYIKGTSKNRVKLQIIL